MTSPAACADSHANKRWDLHGRPLGYVLVASSTKGGPSWLEHFRACRVT
jgi:hypothetical protein